VQKTTITVELSIPDQLCKDFLTACVEGGSAYWLACKQVKRDTDLNVIRLIGCFDREHDAPGPASWGDATAETIRLGIQRILSGSVKVGSHVARDVLMCVLDPDYTGWDAETADCVLQAGLLNEIVYG